jgi:hypothetical protein
MKYNKLLIGSFFSLALISIVIFIVRRNTKEIETLYVKFFKQTTSILQKNPKGQIDGEALYYKDGLLVQQGNFINGSKEGWMIRYNKRGRIEGKVYYQNDKENGSEYVYYESGKLKYLAHWKNGIRFGSLLYYYENGKPELYHAYDIAGDKFNILRYDLLGNISEHKGFAVSNKIYSVNRAKDSVVVLKTNNTYHNIKDLFLNVATPPNVNILAVVIINNIQQNNLAIKDNTVLIPSVFDRNGTYQIMIHEQILDKNNKPLESRSFEITVKKA